MPRVGLMSPAWTSIAACAVSFLAAVPTTFAQQTAAPATTLDRIRATGQLKLGYRLDTRPFSFRDESGDPAGYSVALCEKVADAVKTDLGMPSLNVQWIPVTAADRFDVVRQGQVDLLCGAASQTLARRETVSFSIPVFPSGIGAMLRSDAPVRLQEILSGQPQRDRPVWRANAGQLLQTQVFGVLGGTTAESWLDGKLTEFHLTARVVSVDDYAAGIQQVRDRKVDVLFGDRAVLLDAASRDPDNLSVLDRLFTYEPVALALARGDDDFRLLVDRALSRLYTSGEIRAVYTQWFGEPGENVQSFFRWITPPEE